MSNRPVNFYFLSSGYCGTRFHHHALRLATNAEVWHQPGHEDIAEIVDLLTEPSCGDEFLRATIEEFPRLKRRIDKRLTLPWVYGDTLNWMRGLGSILYRYIGPERLRLVQLVRHPVATCRSMLADSRRTAEVASSDLTLARSVADRWVRQYSCIRRQFEAIADAAVCRTVRLEETGVEQLRELYEFLSLEGFDEAAILSLLEDTTGDVRHYHQRDAAVPASREELRAVWEVCASLAEEYGYEEGEEFYQSAPTRPSCRTPDVEVEDEVDVQGAMVKLHDYRGLGLIVKRPSGIRYINPAGGPISFWLRAEGAFVPLAEGGEGTPGQRLFDHFHLRRDKRFMNCLRERDADFIESVLAESGMNFIEVNRTRIGEVWDESSWETWTWSDLGGAPWEAWVPVTIHSVAYDRTSGALSGPDAREAILVWENSN